MELQIKNYPYLKNRSAVWIEIVAYIVREIGPVDTMLDIGSGFCDFINFYPANNKICYERNPLMKNFASDQVLFICDDATELKGLEANSVDFVFSSNFLEHLSSSHHDILLPRIGEVLKSDGIFIIVQPNYRLCKNNYFDDETHRTIFSDQTIEAFLNNYKFRVVKIVPNFLPLTLKSFLPKWRFLVRWYLASKLRPFAGQMYVVARFTG